MAKLHVIVMVALYTIGCGGVGAEHQDTVFTCAISYTSTCVCQNVNHPITGSDSISGLNCADAQSTAQQQAAVDSTATCTAMGCFVMSSSLTVTLSPSPECSCGISDMPDASSDPEKGLGKCTRQSCYF